MPLLSTNKCQENQAMIYMQPKVIQHMQSGEVVVLKVC